jgi:hypothetical protein
MDNNMSEKLKIIDGEISNALDTITELEEKLSAVKTDEEGYVLKDECVSIREKFASFNKSLQEVTRLLVESGILNEEDVK